MTVCWRLRAWNFGGANKGEVSKSWLLKRKSQLLLMRFGKSHEQI
jgi:hypothetical protein